MSKTMKFWAQEIDFLPVNLLVDFLHALLKGISGIRKETKTKKNKSFLHGLKNKLHTPLIFTSQKVISLAHIHGQFKPPFLNSP
jgi:hypothetical protein